MRDCCSENKPHKLRECPTDGTPSKQVSSNTLKHQIINPWQFKLEDEVYYHCKNPSCDTVYFNADNLVIKKEQIRREDANDELICYCYGVNRNEYLQDKSIKEFVINETKLKNCACEVRNPSGKCCLADFD